jgi:hypothetical protein
LSRYAHLEITSVAPPLSESCELEKLSPDVVLFDLDSPHREDILRLLESCSCSLLVGVSPDANVVKLWTGMQLEELSMDDLMDVIEKQLDGSRDCGVQAEGAESR